MVVQGEGSPDALLTVKYDAVHFTRGRGIELARGPYKAFPHFIGVREKKDTTMPANVAPDFAVDSFENLEAFRDSILDFVFVWGGIDVTIPMLDEFTRILKPGGYLVVAPREGPMVVQQLCLAQGYVDLPWNTTPKDKPTVCIVRHGAIGDTLQSASILAQLKREGYHVTWMGEPQAHELLKHDPNIDAFLIQDKDQIPNVELPLFWKQMQKRFTRWINLCESVEGTLIKLPGRSDYLWPDALRREMCDINYLEFTAKLASIEFHPEHRFYANDEEREKAQAYVDVIKEHVNRKRKKFERSVKPYLVMWALAGSSVHKFYPHQDAVIARILLEIPEAHIILVGDPACKILEAGWEKEPRVHCESGLMALRDTLTLAQQCNLVIGGETGVLNAMAFEPSAKVCLLSHSSAKNLTLHWHNAVGLASSITPCYPCHRLHYTREYCPEDKASGASRCQADIHPSAVWEQVSAAYHGWKTVGKILEAA